MALKLRRAEEQFIPQSPRAVSFKRLLGGDISDRRSTPKAARRLGHRRIAHTLCAQELANPALAAQQAEQKVRGVDTRILELARGFGRRLHRVLVPLCRSRRVPVGSQSFLKGRGVKMQLPKDLRRN